MDSTSEEEQFPNLEDHVLPRDVAEYKVVYDKKDEFNRKKFPVSRSVNGAGRVKRVVSCKRKTHHPAVARKKPSASGRLHDMTNKENEADSTQAPRQEMFSAEPQNVNKNPSTFGAGSKHMDSPTLGELSRDHDAMTHVLFGRNLRLKVALTLWKRNVGELLTYFLRTQDSGVFVDFLPTITKSINENSPSFSIGCCVDLFPLVKKLLTSPYEEYLVIGFRWINSILKNWPGELRSSGFSGATNQPLDKNFQVFNQQLSDLWQQQRHLKSFPGTAGDQAMVIDHFLSQLS